MEREHVSRASIAIEASSADVWDALVNPATAKAYFFGAKVHSDWKEGSPITFTGDYRHWTFRIESGNAGVVLSVTEDNIPDETKRARSDEFWSGVLSTIKGIVESRT